MLTNVSAAIKRHDKQWITFRIIIDHMTKQPPTQVVRNLGHRDNFLGKTCASSSIRRRDSQFSQLINRYHQYTTYVHYNSEVSNTKSPTVGQFITKYAERDTLISLSKLRKYTKNMRFGVKIIVL